MRVEKRKPLPDDRPSAEPPQQAQDRTDKTVAAQGETQRATARMPHERDESADEQAGASLSDPIGNYAHADAVRGIPDTSRAQQTDETYHRLRASAPAATGPGQRPGEAPGVRKEKEKEAPGGVSAPAPGASRR